MKKLLVLILIINYSLPIVIAQNLVPNPSFEEYYLCPDSNAMVQYAVNWFPDGGTPDYFNACATVSWFKTPNNKFGYQVPLTGNAYAGFGTFSSISSNEREFITIKLLDTLQIGNKYFISFFVNLADSSNCVCNKIGVKFKTYCYYWTEPNNFSQFSLDTFILEKNKWTKISGSFIADSAFTYVEFGNFFDDNNIDTIIIGNQSTAFCNIAGYTSYYYIDDICISKDSLYCNSQTKVNSKIQNDNINIFPNPATNILKINCNNIINNIEIYNSLGNKIKKLTVKSNIFTIDVSNLKNGIYILKITDNKNQSFNKKFVKF